METDCVGSAGAPGARQGQAEAARSLVGTKRSYESSRYKAETPLCLGRRPTPLSTHRLLCRSSLLCCCAVASEITGARNPTERNQGHEVGGVPVGGGVLRRRPPPPRRLQPPPRRRRSQVFIYPAPPSFLPSSSDSARRALFDLLLLFHSTRNFRVIFDPRRSWSA